jgi:hypothetical protein
MCCSHKATALEPRGPHTCRARLPFTVQVALEYERNRYGSQWRPYRRIRDHTSCLRPGHVPGRDGPDAPMIHCEHAVLRKCSTRGKLFEVPIFEPAFRKIHQSYGLCSTCTDGVQQDPSLRQGFIWTYLSDLRDGTEATSRHPSKRTRKPAHPAYSRLLQHAVQIHSERVMQWFWRMDGSVHP